MDKFAQIYRTPRFLFAVRNTLILGIASSAIAVSLATYLAWLTERTTAPFRNLIYILVLLPLVLPGIVQAIAWVLILGERAGIANHLLSYLGVGPVFNAFTLPAMIWASASDNLSLPFLLMAAAFRTMNPSLEEASEACGASYRHTFWRITLPMLLPASLGAFVIVFIRVIEDFNVPAAMAIPGGVAVFATEVWLALMRFPTDFNVGAAIGVNYLFIALMGLTAYYFITRVGEKYVTVTGKAYRPTRRSLGRRYLHTATAFSILAVTVVLPFLVTLYASFVPFYEVPTAQSLSRISFANYQWALESESIRGAFRNNVLLAIPTGVVTMLLAAAVSWVSLRSASRGRRLLDAIAFSPIAIPGLVMGLAFVWFYLSVPIPIYGTLWILGLAFAAKFMAYGVRATHASLSQLDVELEEASRVSGAPLRMTLRRVVLPLMSGGLLAGFIYITSLTFKVLSLPALLSGPRSKILPVYIMDMYSNGQLSRLSAVGVLLFLVLVCLFGAARFVARRFGYEAEESKFL